MYSAHFAAVECQSTDRRRRRSSRHVCSRISRRFVVAIAAHADVWPSRVSVRTEAVTGGAQKLQPSLYACVEACNARLYPRFVEDQLIL